MILSQYAAALASPGWERKTKAICAYSTLISLGRSSEVALCPLGCASFLDSFFFRFHYQESWWIPPGIQPKKRNSFPYSFFQWSVKRNSCKRNMVPAKNQVHVLPSRQNVTIPQHVDQKRVRKKLCCRSAALSPRPPYPFYHASAPSCRTHLVLWLAVTSHCPMP